ncbi:MAG TPA: UDP-N-acetylglucosamine 1-carboxyvinyltransferase [Solirubrobacteraceae bacterium]|jgi:UDP-N-acetylglucosamine 1-carboxyvinyltransferase|nr:UDP-N-acetylglucosamine 1-carboxyvinyltransferase [Solirubrobacteraceae bacterium]
MSTGTISFDASDVRDAADADRTLRIRGGRSLRGEVHVRGAKNTLPKNMVAALLTDQECLLHNVAGIRDVEIVGRMIRALGGTVAREGSGEIRMRADNLVPLSREDAAEFSGRSRIPVLLCGPLLSRVGEFFIPDLGGCNIGPRPIDFHLEALVQLGAAVQETSDGVRLTANRLHGAKIRLPYPSVGATEQVLLSAVLAEGITELSNAAIEPEIIDLIAVLQKMGATISVETDRVITINGVERMHGFEHSALPDRLETASWACAALATDGRIFVAGAHQLDMMTFLNAFRRVGGEFRVSDDGIEFWRRVGSLRSVALETDVHPGFMTDWQQPFVVALTQAMGVSIVHETVYEDRFGYTSALNDMGAQIQLYRECLGGRKCRFGRRNHLHSAVVVGPTPLRGTEIHIPDLRAGFSYVIAALVADGLSTITNVGLIRRGYEHFEDKLLALGAELDNAPVTLAVP